MPEKTFHLMIATPTGWVVKCDAESLIIPAADGYMGILAHHAPLMTVLAIGTLSYRDSSGYDHVFAVTEGFLEVSENTVTILADAAETKEKINIDRARQALERAKERLNKSASDPRIDVDRARAAYNRALNRIKIATGESPK